MGGGVGDTLILHLLLRIFHQEVQGNSPVGIEILGWLLVHSPPFGTGPSGKLRPWTGVSRSNGDTRRI